jgi:hypothetical protein
MSEVKSYNLIHTSRLDALEDAVGELRGVLEDPVYADEPWALIDAYAEAMYILNGMKASIDGTEKQLHTLYKDKTNRTK